VSRLRRCTGGQLEGIYCKAVRVTVRLVLTVRYSAVGVGVNSALQHLQGPLVGKSVASSEGFFAPQAREF